MRTTREEIIKLSKGQINPHVLEERATTLYGRVLEDALSLHNIVEAIGKIERHFVDPDMDPYDGYTATAIAFNECLDKVNTIITDNGDKR